MPALATILGEKCGLFALLLVAFVPLPCSGGELTIGNLFAPEYRQLSRDLAALVRFKQVAPAVPLGTRGFEVGLELAVTDINQEADYWTLVTDNPPDYLAVPKLRLIKGLPWSVDIGGMLTFEPTTEIYLWGVEAKWTVVEEGVGRPAAALRLSGSDLGGVEELDYFTLGVDLSVTKTLGGVLPYAGVGALRVWSSAKVKAIEDEELVATEDVDFLTYHAFAGLRFHLPLVTLTAEIEVGERPTLSARLVFVR